MQTSSVVLSNSEKINPAITQYNTDMVEEDDTEFIIDELEDKLRHYKEAFVWSVIDNAFEYIYIDGLEEQYG